MDVCCFDNDEAAMELHGIFKFIKYFGSQQAAAEAIGIKQQAISNWIVRGKIPYEQVLRIACATKGFIKPHELVPYEKEMNKIFGDLIQLYSAPQNQLITSKSSNGTSAREIQSHRSIISKSSIANNFQYFELLLPWCKQDVKALILINIEEKTMMRDYSKISPQFWVGRTGREIRQLGIETRIIALYLMTCPHANMLGIYYLPVAYIVHDIEMNYEVVSGALKKLNEIGFCTYDEQAEYIWVHEMAKHQISDYLEERDKRVKAVNDIFHSLPELIFLKDFYEKYEDIFHLQPRKEMEERHVILNKNPTTAVVNEKNYPFEGASKALRSQEQEQEQEQKQEQEQEEEQEQEGKHKRSLRHRQGRVLEKTELPTPPINSPLSFVIAIPLRDDSEFFITPVMFDEWQQLYPAIDVLQLLKNIRGWNLANPNKRKTRKGILQHINQWLVKENSKPMKSSIFEKPGGFNLFDHNTQVATAWLDQDGSFMKRELINEGE